MIKNNNNNNQAHEQTRQYNLKPREATNLQVDPCGFWIHFKKKNVNSKTENNVKTEMTISLHV